MRRSFLLVPIAVALAVGAFMWFRASSFVSVQSVRITGVTGADARQIDAALRRAAGRMSTLDVNVGALRAAVASYPQIRAIDVSTSFPHGLRIAVAEQPAVAVLQTPSGTRSAVAADGAVLGSALATGELTAIAVPAPLPRAHVHNGTVLAYLAVLGAAPAPLGRLVARVYDGPKGTTVAMRSGMLVYFGDASRPHAKWLAFASVVLASHGANAAYVDVRLPERAAVATGEAAASSAASGTASSAAQGSLSTSAALVAGLQAAIGGAGGQALPQGSSSTEEQGQEQNGAASQAAPSGTEASGSSEAEAKPSEGVTGG